MDHPSPLLSVKSIRRHFARQIFARGERLFNTYSVLSITHEHAKNGFFAYYGEVMGDSGVSYSCSIYGKADDILDSECDCPYGANCKHSCALAFAALDYMESADPEDEINHWLGQVQQTVIPQDPRAQNGDWSIFYLLNQSETEALYLTPILRYRKKDGDWGRLQELPLHLALQRKDLMRDDITLLNLLKGLKTSYSYEQGMRSCRYTLEGAAGHLVLSAALASERLVDNRHLEPIVQAEAQTLHWQWEQSTAGFSLLPILGDEMPPSPEVASTKSTKPTKTTKSTAKLKTKSAPTWHLVPTDPPMYCQHSHIGMLRTTLTLDLLQLLLAMPSIPAERYKDISQQLAYLTGDNNLPLPENVEPLIRIDSFKPKLSLMGVYNPVSGYLPALRLTAIYGDWEQPLLSANVKAKQQSPDQDQVVEHQGQQFIIQRRHGEEYAVAKQLRTLELISYDFKGDTGELWVPTEINPQRYLQLWNKQLHKLQTLVNEHDWLLEIDDSYQYRENTLNLDAEASNYSNGWFDFDMRMDIGGRALNTADLVTQWLAAGAPPTLALQNAQQQWEMVDMTPLQPILSLLLELYGGGKQPKQIRIPAFRALALDELEDTQVKQPLSLKKLRQGLRNFNGIAAITPDKKLNAALRDYQQQGLSWLMFLHTYGFGGILADDMGLGKTLQTLAFIQKLKATRKLTRGALIVAPTSLIWNWLAEAQKFTPNLRCLMLHGSDRKMRFEEIAGHDLIITSYGLIVRDSEIYTQYHFDVTVLDEAQNIKNTQAKTTQHVKQLNADMRLCLSGTPLENHLSELWSLMDFALPGLLSSHEHFRKYYRHPIEQDGDHRARQELSGRIAPFMLRRTKSEVVHELPAKTEILQTLELGKEQKSLYESIRISMEKRVRTLIQTKGVARSRIEFLDALLKLRQACIDPRLVKLEQAKKVTSGAKMQWLCETLPELIEEGRKILIFSQFTQMLDLIETQLHELGIATTKLTGRTRKRQEVIEAFQEGTIPVFLISLKAGGSGLNLTAADTIIHVDPWWNPAVENQATDRAYRIGQDKPVFVYKLVVAGTLEEKIQLLQQQKQALADSLFDETSKAPLPLAGDDLLALFS